MGGSFDTFKWAKDSRVGEHPAKLVLIMMADKVNAQFELYPSKKDLAHDCEMSKRTLDKWLTYLADAGFITVIERLRANSSQGRTTMLVNHPDAPHMNGQPTVLDYQGHHLYPKDPDQLRAAGIQWISGTKLNAELPQNPDSSADAKKSREETGGPKSKGGADPASPPVQTLHPPRADPAPPGGADPAPLISPKELTQPTNAGAHTPDDGHGEASVVGWSTPPNEEHADKSAGAGFLSRLAFEDGSSFAPHAARGLADHVDLLLISGWTEDGITARITDATGAGKVANWAGFARRKLEALRPLPASNATASSPGADPLPPWCGECEAADFRFISDAAGRARRCPTCNHRTQSRSSAA